MSSPALSAEEMLKWNEQTSQRFRKLFEENPQALQLECDIAKTNSIAELMQHIVAVELRYAERLAGKPETQYEQVPYGTVEEIFSTHDRAIALFREALAVEGTDWNEELEFVTRSLGKMIATRNAVFFHALTHSVRHYAQITTLLRQHGITMQYPLDYLFVAARRV